MFRKAGPLALTLTLLFAGALPLAWAARLQQGRLHRMKACVGLIPTYGDPEAGTLGNSTPNPDPTALDRLHSPNPNPYVFYVMDQRTDVKPDGWDFYNPAAPIFVNNDQAARWGLTLNQPLSADMAAYWEVPISEANYDALARMDVIYLPIARTAPVHFTEEQRRVLMRLADAGVTIWVDWALQAPTQTGWLGGTTLNTRDSFFTNLDFVTTGSAGAVPTLEHPLLDSQFYLDPSNDAPEIGSRLGANGGTTAHTGRAIATQFPDLQPSANFSAVIASSDSSIPPNKGGYIVAARMGAGFVVGTAGNVGGAIATAGNGGVRAAPYTASLIAGTGARVTTPQLYNAEPEDLKFAYNIFAWRNEVTAAQKNGRHTTQGNAQLNGMIEQATYPFLVRPPAGGAAWRGYPVPGQPLPVSNPVPPLIVNNSIIAYTQYKNPYNNQLISELNLFDQDPNRHFLGGANADDTPSLSTNAADRMVDYDLGQPYDRIASLGPETIGANFPLVTGISMGELPDPRTAAQGGQGGKPYVFVAGPGGGSFGFGLFCLPLTRPGYPNAVIGDLWTAANIGLAPDMKVSYTGAPAFAVVPGPPVPPAGPGSTAQIFPLGQLYAGGQVQAAAFGSPTSSNGKVVALNTIIDPATGKPNMTPAWYYPPNNESNRMGTVAGPVSTAQVEDVGTGAVDQIVFTTSCSSGDPNSAQNQAGGGDTTGGVNGFIVATKGDVLNSPRGNNVPNANAGDAGRRFVSARWLDVAPGTGTVPQPQELRWDPTKYYEVRVMDKDRNYVLARYTSTDSNVANRPTLLPDGTAGQVALPPPPAAFQVTGQPTVWDLNKVVLVADYSPMPLQVDNGGATLRPRFAPSTPYFRGQQQLSQPTGIAGGVSVGKDNLVYYGTGQGYMCAAEWRRGRAQFRWKMKSEDYLDQTGASTDVNPSTNTGAPNPNYLNDYAFVSAPAVGDRVVFASRGRNGAPGTAYIFEPDATIRFKLNGLNSMTQQQALALMLEGDHGLGLQANNPFLLSQQQPWGRVPGQFTVDPDTATVTFHNMENFSLDLSKALSPQQLAAIPAAAGGPVFTGNRPAVPINWKINLPAPNNLSGTAYIPLPLVAKYQASTPSPEHFLSGPLISGDRAYVMGSRGFMHELPLDPTLLEPRFPAAGPKLTGFDLTNPLYGAGLRRVRQISSPATDNGGTPIDAVIPTPAVVQGTVAVSCPRGLAIYNSPNVVIADSNRIVEASGDSTTLATTDVVTKHRTQQSEFAIPSDPQFTSLAANQIFQERKLLNRPAAVRKLSRSSSFTSIFMSSSVPASDTPTTGAGAMPENALADESYLAADTGNNRAVEFNPAGKVVWECSDFQDPLKYLPAGEPLTLSGPMDVQRWTETEPGPSNTTVIVVHTLITDTGNTRVLEIVDKLLPQRGQFTPYSFYQVAGQNGVDGNPIRWYHVLVWSSQTNAQGLKLRYRSAQRVYWTNGNGVPVAAGSTGGNPLSVPPYLPKESYLSYTMCAVNGSAILYADDFYAQSVSGQDYNQFTAAGKTPSMGWLDRIPKVRPGADSIVFLRGRYKLDTASGLSASPPTAVPVGNAVGGPFAMREPRVAPNGATLSNDQFRFTQGVIDPNVPTITDLFDDKDSPQVTTPVHSLRGVNSVQRTIRRDVKFQPEDFTGSGQMQLGQYFLIADQDGVWETRMLPLAAGSTTPQMRLNLAFTVGDYSYVTGAGAGNPLNVFTPGGGVTGGRLMWPSSARRLPNGMILVTSRMPSSDQPLNGGPPNLQGIYQPDVFLLRAADYLTARERQQLGLPLDYRIQNTEFHGWRPDTWVAAQNPGAIPILYQGPPSIRWRAAETLDPTRPPSSRTTNPMAGGPNPNELTGSYAPVQPSYADVVY